VPTAPGDYWWVVLIGTTVIGVLVLGFLATLLIANRRLREEHDFSETILREAPAAIVVLNANGEVIRANELASRVLGNDRESLIGKPLTEIPALENVLGPKWENLLHDDTTTVESSMELGTPQGEIRELNWTFTALDGPTAAVRWIVGIGVDLTERKQLERLLFEAQKMEAIGRLAGGVAHDFNNMLTAIMGYCYSLEKHLSNDSKAAEVVREIDSTAERAGRLTRQLLAFSRRQVFEPKPLVLREVILGFERMVRGLLGETVEVHFELDEGDGKIKADPAQIERILVNLVLNARDAMPDGGALFIRSKQLEAEDDFCRKRPPLQPGQYYLLEVEDTGVGMDEETLSHIFEPFFTTKAPGEGTGLGLATVYGLVRQLKGYIFVHSKLGEGTRFEIFLPLIADDDPLVPPGTESCSGKLAGTVLVAEDNPQVRSLAAETLREKGAKVYEAPDGREALKQAELLNHEIDLLITDVVMPQMSGRELAQRLSSRNGNLRVLYISGYPEDTVRKRGLVETNAFVLPKPFAPNELLGAVARTLESRPRREDARE